MSYLRHVVHVSVPRPLLHCHRKHFRGNGLGGGGRPKRRLSLARPTATAARSTDRPLFVYVTEDADRDVLGGRRSASSTPTLLFPSSSFHHCEVVRSVPLSQALGPLRQPLSVGWNQPVVLVRRARTHRARLPPSFVRWLATVTFLPGLSRRRRSRPKLAEEGGSL